MKKIKIGIVREEKQPHDKRVPFTPEQCSWIIANYNEVDLCIQPSAWRCYSDEEYTKAGVSISEDISNCDVLLGIKEVPPDLLIPEKHYLFFSHTIKKQEHNRKLLQESLKKKIKLTDYECLVDHRDNRIIGFGRYAGIVGAYNGVMAYGKHYKLFDLKPADQCHDKKEVFSELQKANLPNIKIVVTGSGRVANGACETMGAMNLRKVTPYEFLNYTFREPVYVQLHSEDYYEARDNSPYSSWDFHNNPESYRCKFSDANSFASVTDLLIHCTYWDPKADILFSKSRMRDPDFRISVIADVTCDINGSIPSTMKASTIDNKFYGYDPLKESITDPFGSNVITVMAIDNLPCELPRDASEGFGKHLIERVLPSLTGRENTELIERATIANNGALMPRFDYLKDYAGL
ncbi:MAG: alanine dehydrogenase [Bacteroidetes bacterium]|nr:MAG: alanine dehydrogenase [Bacteroidota bacterium]REK06964.1 MAG: alanine dehydrogenase [Bacteroidota bacterium]REK33688.1 MAG: alanine dehydrogenase [Bacteroidota bacterium]REK47235.1 MAG: alanine dehydrogenase [Bacteroidota bacterium]